MAKTVLEELFDMQDAKIEALKTNLNERTNDNFASSFAYSFVDMTLAEATTFGTVPRRMYFITNARKSGETAGNGTGLPAFYDEDSASWVDFAGNAITV